MRVLGELVAKTLGGKISKQQVRKIGYEMHVIELKRAKASNVIPIGSLKLGLYRGRALLFKLLADLTGVPATLGRFHLKSPFKKISSLISNSVFLKKKRPKLLSCQKYFCGAWGIVRNFIILLNLQIKGIK